MNQQPIFKIVSNSPSNVMRFEMFFSDYCNYQCWYCSKEFNGKTVKWPTLDVLLPNILHLLEYYKTKGKSKFIIHIGGGEPSQWPDLITFASEIKKRNDCLISLTTNGSRTLRWWEENVKHFDHIGLSVHHERADATHLKTVGDIIYKNNVSMWALVLMDPNCWDKCLSIVEELKTSKYNWSISANQIHSEKINYTEDQKKYLNKKILRPNSMFYDFFVNRNKRPKYHKPTVFFKDTKKNVSSHWLLLNGYNNFKGWQCNIGVDTAFIDKNGDIKGMCGTTLYNKDFYYNVYDENFKFNFQPDIEPIVCKMTKCFCQPEVNCTKQLRIDNDALAKS